jgi:hypothetical protein
MKNEKAVEKAADPRLLEPMGKAGEEEARKHHIPRPEKPAPIQLNEGDFAEKRYRLSWEGSDPLDFADLKKLKDLIEDWAMGKVPDKTIALKAPRLLDKAIKQVEGVDEELTGCERLF